MQLKIKREDLQAELLSLKQEFGSKLHLKKAPADVLTAPFPILASFVVDAPAAAESYDVSSVKAVVTVKANPDESDIGRGEVSVAVISPELPTTLQNNIGNQLHEAWQQRHLHEGGLSSLHLSFMFQYLQQNFLSLITSMPEFLEPYQSVNADGATVRRYAIVNPDNQVQIDVHATGAAPKATRNTETKPHQRKKSQACEKSAAAACHDSVSQASTATAGDNKASGHVHVDSTSAGVLHTQQAGSVRVEDSASNTATVAVPAGIRSAVTYMQRRYSDGLTVLIPYQTSDTDAAQSPGEQSQSAANPVCTFLLTMQPTDPAWDAKQLQSLKLQGHMGALYPQQGSYGLQLDPQQQQLLGNASSIVDQLIAGEGRQHAGRPGAMQQLLRFVDNRAGMLFHEAEDIVLEARRRQSQAQAQSHTGGQAPPPPPAPLADGAQASTSPDRDSIGSTAQDSSARDEPASQQESADTRPSICHTQDLDLAGDLASDLDNAHLGDDEPKTSEQDTEETWSDSHWDSSASYAGHDQHSSDSDYHHELSDADDRPQPGGAAAANSDGLDRNALQLQLQDLRLDNVDALEALKLNIQMVCNRCPATADMAFASDAVASGSQQVRGGSIEMTAQCSNCHQDWSASLTSRLVHDHSNVLASLRAHGCSPLDLLPSLMAAQCSNCSAAASLRNAQVGVACSRACSSCHTNMTIQFSAVAFVATASPAASQAKPKHHRRKQASTSGTSAGPDPALVVGQPLPHMGTCKHYHHSHRWLRFPCCGRRFACDLCHEEQTDGHEMKWAQRMVCGYCSTEQPLGEQCKHCSKRIALSARGAIGAVTTHWQGGEGCRDKKMMDRRDAAKYRNSKHKSVSKKSARVGKEGAARQQRGQKADK